MVDGVHTWALDQCLCVGTANPPVCIPCGHAHVSGVQCNMPTQTPEVDGTHGTVITVSFCTCAGHGDGRFRYCGIGMKP